MPDQDEEEIDADWHMLRRQHVGQSDQPAVQPSVTPWFPDANLRVEVQDVLRLLRTGMAVGSLQRRLIELAQAFSVRPEDVPEGLLLEREKATLRWISMSPYFPMSSPVEALELVGTATWLASKPTQEQRSARADELLRILEPALR